MTVSPVASDDVAFEAASLAAAILRFEEPAAHQTRAFTPPGVSVIGVDAYAFAPGAQRVPRHQVSAFLATLPSPALLAPTTRRGIVTLTLLDELVGERRASIQRELDNQVSALARLGSEPDESRVLLEFDEESHLFSLAAVRMWAARFALTVGWSISPCEDGERAEWRLNLIGGAGRLTSHLCK